MMKNNFLLRSFRVLSLVFFAALLMNACAQEDFNPTESNHSDGNYKIKSVNRLSYDEMLRKLPNATLNRNLKYSYASADGKSMEEFDIDTTLVKQIVFDEQGISYTVKLIPKDSANTENELYNLTISQNNGATEEKIYKYILENGKVVADEDHVEVVYSKTSNGNCIKIIFPCEYGNYHQDGTACLGHGTSFMIVCAGGGPTDTGGDGPGNPPGDGPTTPTGPGGFDPQEGGNGGNTTATTPCAKVKAVTTNTTYKSNISILKGKTGDTYESGFRMNLPVPNGAVNQLLQNVPGSNTVNLVAFANTYGIMHSHYDSLFPMFSPGDILFFNQWVNYVYNNNFINTPNVPVPPLGDIFFTLVTINGNYMLKFDESITPSQLSAYTQKQFDDLNNEQSKLLDKAKSVANVSGNVTFDMDRMEKEFLKFVKDKMNMPGLKLYKTESNGTNTEIYLENGNKKEKKMPIIINLNKMKKILLLIVAILSQLYYSQEYPLDYKGDVPNNAYYKDLTGELDKYVGLWKGNWNGKTLYVELRKVKYYYGGNNPYYQDEIQGERKIINSNGIIEIDRISNFDSDGTEFRGIGTQVRNVNIKRIYFYPRNMCRKQATLDIMSFTGTQMTLHLEYLPSYINETCPYYNSVMQGNDYPINFPKDILLTKQ